MINRSGREKVTEKLEWRLERRREVRNPDVADGGWKRRLEVGRNERRILNWPELEEKVLHGISRRGER